MSSDRIIEIHTLSNLLQSFKTVGKKIIATSGGFAPAHSGHLACLEESSLIELNSILVVIVNSDEFLMRKKGKIFMNHQERMEMVAAIRYVDYVTGWEHGSQTVCGALAILKPDIFTKGADRSERSAVPEADICDKINCKIMYGVGGSNKMQSSSALISGI